MGQSDLTVVLVDLLRASNAGQDGRDALHEQAGRVVANFVADNDDNRSRTISTDYLSIASAYVASTLKSPASADRPRVAGKESPEDVERQAARKAVIASFLNLVVQGHGEYLGVITAECLVRNHCVELTRQSRRLRLWGTAWS